MKEHWLVLHMRLKVPLAESITGLLVLQGLQNTDQE
jgi:hypothetical protein